MKSIRLSLTVYVLALSGLALGVGLLLIYQTAYQQLQEHKTRAEEQAVRNKETAAKLITAQSQASEAAASRDFDQALGTQAVTLAKLVQSHFEQNRAQFANTLNAMNWLTLTPGPGAAGAAALSPPPSALLPSSQNWAAQGFYHRLRW